MNAPPPQAPARKRSRLFRIFRVLIVLVVVAVAFAYFVYVLPFWGVPFNQSRHGRVPLTPPWALECWLWEDDVNTEDYVKELLEGYARNDIPVRTILIDSPWTWRYNDFKPDETRYPEPEKFFRSLKSQGYRIVLWMTCMVNSQNKDTKILDSRDWFEQARTNSYLTSDGKQLRWWKGKGGFIDYSNPAAMDWWHGLQRQVLDWGADGWKLDGCDTYFSSRIGGLPLPFSRAHLGWMTTRQYMDHYARDEYAFGLSRNPEFIIMIRALDHRWVHPEGFAPLDAATVTWVGDNRHTWNYDDRGIDAALDDILNSAKLGYCVIGSDVAGYHGHSHPGDMSLATAELFAKWRPGNDLTDRTNRTGLTNNATAFLAEHRDDEIAPNIYIRWAEFSAFCGFFLNGGHGERRLWKRTVAELEIIRKFSWLHTELVPYMYSHVVRCHQGGPALMRPLGRGKFHYLFGDDFLVAPIHEDKLKRSVSLPPGRWRYLFDDREVFEGPTEVARDFPLDEYPVYVRDGAVIPLKVKRAYTGFGDEASADSTTWLIYPSRQGGQFTLYHPESHPHLEQTTVRIEGLNPLRIGFSGKHEPHLLRILAETKPAAVTLDQKSLPESAQASGALEPGAWRFDPAQRRLIIKTPEYVNGNYLVRWSSGQR